MKPFQTNISEMSVDELIELRSLVNQRVVALNHMENINDPSWYHNKASYLYAMDEIEPKKLNAFNILNN